LAIAIYCSAQLRNGAWAILGVVGALVGAIPAFLWSLGWAQIQWTDGTSVFDLVNRHESIAQLDWSRPLAVVLLGAALVTAHRTGLRQGNP
jgi:hypothetical protein